MSVAGNPYQEYVGGLTASGSIIRICVQASCVSAAEGRGRSGSTAGLRLIFRAGQCVFFCRYCLHGTGRGHGPSGSLPDDTGYRQQAMNPVWLNGDYLHRATAISSQFVVDRAD